jgi:hypothetical protein
MLYRKNTHARHVRVTLICLSPIQHVILYTNILKTARRVVIK